MSAETSICVYIYETNDAMLSRIQLCRITTGFVESPQNAMLSMDTDLCQRWAGLGRAGLGQAFSKISLGYAGSGRIEDMCKKRSADTPFSKIGHWFSKIGHTASTHTLIFFSIPRNHILQQIPSYRRCCPTVDAGLHGITCSVDVYLKDKQVYTTCRHATDTHRQELTSLGCL